ncbi:MAG: hypothetical protein ICV60_23805 [Pyrinomonadaceae bacterium]|nr:hypothetical protein [Pyrinomonadaceae bacterium]
MEEAKDPKSGVSASEGSKTKSDDEQSEATSTKTLSDLESAESKPESGSKSTEVGQSSSVPSPDGQFDEQRGGRDAAGPM